MKNLSTLNVYRVRTARIYAVYGSYGDSTCGVFEIPSPIDKATLLIVASSALEWDHISVSRRNRCPNWPEMNHIKDLFFKHDETAMQLHVPLSDHINNHPYCLHLWRPHNLEIPQPPAVFVGDKRLGTLM